jgi:hypothetical protein
VNRSRRHPWTIVSFLDPRAAGQRFGDNGTMSSRRVAIDADSRLTQSANSAPVCEING